MAEAAVNLQDQYSSPYYNGEILRQQKAEASRQANSQRINAQIIDFPGINDRLMSRQDSANQPQNFTDPNESNQDESNQVEDEGTATQDTADSLKQAQQLAKLAANPTVAGAAAVVGEMAIDAIKKGEGGKMVTGQMLKTWWSNLIPSWGGTLPFLNLQAFVGFIEGHKFFCKLGEEWKAPGIFKKAIGSLETSGLISLDLLIFLTFLCIFAILGFMLNAIEHPLEAIKLFFN